MLEGESDVIESLHQAPTRVIVDIKSGMYRSTPYLTGF
jgi:hypothetical protein